MGAGIGGVKLGSKLLSFNGEMIEDLGAKLIYKKLSQEEMPLTITFLKPFDEQKDEEIENEHETPGGPDSTPPAPPAPSQISIPPQNAPSNELKNGSDSPIIPPKVGKLDVANGNGAKKESFMVNGMALIPQVFAEEDAEIIQSQESHHAE